MMANKASKVKNGDEVKLTRSKNPSIWILRTKEEIDALHAKDAADGRFHDDGGEPIIYNPYGGWGSYDISNVTVVMTSRRPKWVGWTHRPKNLRSGFCAEMNREILFQAV